jgi:hypothetical protein
MYKIEDILILQQIVDKKGDCEFITECEKCIIHSSCNAIYMSGKNVTDDSSVNLAQKELLKIKLNLF